MARNITFGIIGRVRESLCDGQTIKTKNLVEELKKNYPDCKVLIAESDICKRHPFRMLGQMFSCLKYADVIFVLLSINGVRMLLPVLFFMNRFYKKPIIHDCIGGVQDKNIRKYPYLKKYYAKMVVNWVETAQLKQRLQNEGLQNVEVLPNFKNIVPISSGELSLKNVPPFRFCTFSRVNEAKGIGRAAEAVLAINRKAGTQVAQLHVYGPIEENYDAVLDAYIRESCGAIHYCGVAKPEESVEILKDYFVLLFPTTFSGEGFPGTLIDALSAGLPVIATDWHCNGEIIDHEKTGFLYHPDFPEQLETWMTYAIENPTVIHSMGKQCLETVKQYSPETVMKTVCKKIDGLIDRN